ncbi:hypothetical protein H5410_004067, partial [Solanum commersonii]
MVGLKEPPRAKYLYYFLSIIISRILLLTLQFPRNSSINLVVWPPSPALSSRQPRIPRHRLRIRDLKLLAKLRLILPERSKKSFCVFLISTEAEVIPNRNSEAATVIRTTDIDTDVPLRNQMMSQKICDHM